MPNKKCKKCDKVNSEISKYCSQCGYELPKNEPIKMEEPKKNSKPEKNKKQILSLLIGVLAFGISFFGVKTLFHNSLSFDKAMMTIASDINESCPIMIDNVTRLDNTIALPDNVFQYNYTLVDLEKNEINIDELREYIEPNVINNVKTNPDMKEFKDNKVTMAYNYKDKNGVFVLKINVTPDLYE